MGLFVNTNIAAINAQRSLRSSVGNLNRSFQRLSSGLRINTAGDDAAGLSISERFNSQVRGLNQAVRNANDGISLVQTAESALLETTNILQRIRELSVQAASDGNTNADRLALQDEVSQLKAELERIGDTTTFNQQKILDGSYLDKFFHIGINQRERMEVRISDARSSALGRWSVATGTAMTTNALAADDLTVNGVSVRATQSTDDVLSTSFATSSALAKAAAINDSTEFTNVSAYANATVRSGNAGVQGGLLDNANYVQINGRIITAFTVVADDAGDGLLRAINDEAELTGVKASRDSAGRVELTAQDGRNIEVVTVGNGGAFTGLGASDVTLGSMTLHSASEFVLGGNNEPYVGFPDGKRVGIGRTQTVDTVDLSTREGANLALLITDRAIAQVVGDRSELGAVQNRLESTIRNLSAVSEQAASSRSRILDADFATETTNLSRNQILQQAATSILAQANAAPQQALSLLQ